MIDNEKALDMFYKALEMMDIETMPQDELEGIEGECRYRAKAAKREMFRRVSEA